MKWDATGPNRLEFDLFEGFSDLYAIELLPFRVDDDEEVHLVDRRRHRIGHEITSQELDGMVRTTIWKCWMANAETEGEFTKKREQTLELDPDSDDPAETGSMAVRVVSEIVRHTIQDPAAFIVNEQDHHGTVDGTWPPEGLATHVRVRAVNVRQKDGKGKHIPKVDIIELEVDHG